MPTALSDSIVFAPNSDGMGAQFTGLPLGIIGQLGPNGLLGIQSYANHFLQWEGPLAEGSAGGWTLSGTTGVASIGISDARNGEIVLTADATASCNPTLALGSAIAGQNIRYVAGKQLWCAGRVKLGTVLTTELFFGFGTADTSPTVTGTYPADGLFFYKASTDPRLSFQARKDGTGTARAQVTSVLADNTYTIIAFRVDPTGNIHVYQDNVELSTGFVQAGDANLPIAAGDAMQFLIGILGASMTLTLDWVVIAQEL